MVQENVTMGNVRKQQSVSLSLFYIHDKRVDRVATMPCIIYIYIFIYASEEHDEKT